MFDLHLDPDQQRLRAAVRALVVDLATTLAGLDAEAADLAVVRRAGTLLDELFLLVVVGEFNAGKSAFINALLGAELLVEGVTPTTSRVHLLRYAETAGSERVEAALDVVSAPIPLLRTLAIVDTPGTNAIQREHEAISREFVPRSDLVLFVTSADRPFTESERLFLTGIRDWGKKVVVVVNKADLLERDVEVEQVRAFVAEQARTVLGTSPQVWFVSARRALRAKLAGDAAGLEASGFPAFERFLASTLAPHEQVRLKLRNPVGVAEHLVGRYRGAVASRLELLRDDLRTLDDIDRQLVLYRQDMARDGRLRLTDVDNTLHQLELRGIEFFDRTMRLGRLFDLFDKPRLEAAFAREVVADLPETVSRQVGALIDWMVAADLRQWQTVTDHVAARRAEHADRVVGAPVPFELDRDRLLASVGRAAERAVGAYDRHAEAARVAGELQTAIASTALVEVGAVGLGALIAHLVAGVAADVTGVAAASLIAVLGLFILPGRKEAAKRELRSKVAALRQSLLGVLGAELDRELERSVGRIGEAVAPYTRFVRAERERLAERESALGALADRAARLRDQLSGD